MDSAASGKLKLYVDEASQPSRAVLIFCELNGIEYEKVPVIIFKGQHLSEEFAKINLFKQVPAMQDGDLCLSQSHAILKYLHASRGCPDHWYPACPRKRAKVDVYLDWHHNFLRVGAGGFVFRTVFAPKIGMVFPEDEIKVVRKVLDRSITTIDTVFLQTNKYICGSEITIADLS
mmetsp:Transcript_31901/g.36430  ORF Transcript_31901/g.36430 Transcript_31901/m.36430 type:complete len:175 (+) Transcript_31901:2-526(+)